MPLAAVRVCVVYVGYAIRDVRDGVVRHYQDSCVPLVHLWVNREDLDGREEQRGSEGLALLGCPAPGARG